MRYLHLAVPRRLSAPRAAPARLRLLVLCDYAVRYTRRQLFLLAKAAKALAVAPEITVKPHPACPVDAAEFPDLPMTVTMEPVDALLGDCDAACVSAVTSAAIDAYCAGIPVVAVLDPTALNLSPLRGRPDVHFVGTAAELAAALQAIAGAERRHAERPLPFYLDPALPRWRRLLVGQATAQ